MKIFSWNVNGIRAVINKGEFQKFMTEFEPDVLCLQETKANIDQVEEALAHIQRRVDGARAERRAARKTPAKAGQRKARRRAGDTVVALGLRL